MYFEYIKQLLHNTDTKLAMAPHFHPGLEEEVWAFSIRRHWCGPVVAVEGIRRRPLGLLVV